MICKVNIIFVEFQVQRQGMYETVLVEYVFQAPQIIIIPLKGWVAQWEFEWTKFVFSIDSRIVDDFTRILRWKTKTLIELDD